MGNTEDDDYGRVIIPGDRPEISEEDTEDRPEIGEEEPELQIDPPPKKEKAPPPPIINPEKSIKPPTKPKLPN